ncbi:hydrogen peroxide-inducible genes activator [uncultured Litoreibacter sp.]|uniref:hydrogen peroxide-inducible genes activator n=1 Tax=uncultured Litoreibacter sp. TaxID=1392394 RepID=UPI002608BB83|nr:hydrogen peroxide-inducible genes activator [uncultured Litoreibacter sp.]
MKITLRQLSYFAALADVRSFGSAAARCNISQSALSQQIKELEGNLDVQLVERMPRDLQLTRAGEDVLARALPILAQAEDLEQAARLRDGLTGDLKLGIIPTVAPYVLPDLLRALRAAEPGLDIRVREAQTERLLDGVLSGHLDAAVMALPVKDKRLTAHLICSDRFVLAGPADRIASLQGQTDRLRPKQIDPEQLLLLDEGHCLADQALDVCGLADRRQIDLGASSLSTLCGLVSEGFGLTLLPELAVKSEGLAPNLSLARFADPEPARKLALVRRTSSLDAAWVDELRTHLTAACDAQTGYARSFLAPASGAP